VLSQTDAELTAVALLSRAEEVEQREPGYRAELDQWLRTDPGAPDGIPVEAVPEDPATSNWLIRDFLVGHPQMLLRIGWPTSPGTETGRRPVTEVLRPDE
jgi:hypothetical protein